MRLDGRKYIYSVKSPLPICIQGLKARVLLLSRKFWSVDNAVHNLIRAQKFTFLLKSVEFHKREMQLFTSIAKMSMIQYPPLTKRLKFGKSLIYFNFTINTLAT